MSARSPPRHQMLSLLLPGLWLPAAGLGCAAGGPAPSHVPDSGGRLLPAWRSEFPNTERSLTSYTGSGGRLSRTVAPPPLCLSAPLSAHERQDALSTRSSQDASLARRPAQGRTRPEGPPVFLVADSRRKNRCCSQVLTRRPGNQALLPSLLSTPLTRHRPSPRHRQRLR